MERLGPGCGIQVRIAYRMHGLVPLLCLGKGSNILRDRGSARLPDMDYFAIRVFRTEIFYQFFGLGGLSGTDDSFENDVHKTKLGMKCIRSDTRYFFTISWFPLFASNLPSAL